MAYISGRETPAGLVAAQADPDLERRKGLPYAICREEDCGEHHKNLGPHLEAVHNLKGFAYQVKHAVNGVAPPLAGGRTVKTRTQKRDRGRPAQKRTAVIRARARELKVNHSWGQVTQMCNREFKVKFGKSYYRWLVNESS